MFIPIDVPFTGVLNTFAEGINDSGDIVGFYSVGTAIHGFLDSGGAFTPIDIPFADPGTSSAAGINDLGQIVGAYGKGGQGHGFLADPAVVPEPASLLLLAFALTAFVFPASRLRRLPW
jgi:uncharacterized membrane protein